jgi:putative Ca2+/H+ antiporter (TMEM165/GDT1 family)
MDWKLFLTVFWTIFLSELGDKTQLAVLGFSSTHSGVWTVFLGGALALVLSTLLASLIGDSLKHFIPLKGLRITGALLFIGCGLWMLWGEK